MVVDFMKGIAKTQRTCLPAEQVAAEAKTLIDGCYKSFLDPDFNTRLTQIIPSLEKK